MKNKLISKFVYLLVSVVLIFGMNSCGTLLYPERRGQTTGKIDVGVVLLDGLGLLLFVIPGIVAFAVDFSTGAIYLPPEPSSLDDTPIEDMKVVRMDPETLTQYHIQQLIAQKTGHVVDITAPDVKVTQDIQEPEWKSLSKMMSPDQFEVFTNRKNPL